MDIKVLTPSLFHTGKKKLQWNMNFCALPEYSALVDDKNSPEVVEREKQPCNF